MLDVGASQICDKQVHELLTQLPSEIRNEVRQRNLVFRFGDLVPLGKMPRIAIVPGQTPFLLSNSFLKGIKAAIDTDAETL